MTINETLESVSNSPIVKNGTVEVEVSTQSVVMIALAILAAGLILLTVKKYL